MSNTRLQRTSELLLKQLEELSKSTLSGAALHEDLLLKRSVNDTAKRIVETEKAIIDRVRVMNDAGIIEGEVNRPQLTQWPRQ